MKTLPTVRQLALLVTLAFGIPNSSPAQNKSTLKPAELQVIKDAIGVWDAAIGVWPQGKEQESIKFKGVETNRAYGEHWLASDFESRYQGQVQKIHSIVGYDLDQQQLVGKTIDHGPYMATMTGKYDQKTKSVLWTTKVKTPAGKPMVQQTTVTQRNKDERVLVLSMPNSKTKKFTEFMRITYTRRK